MWCVRFHDCRRYAKDVSKTCKDKPRRTSPRDAHGVEPEEEEKLTADNMVFSSCNVKAGTAVGVVVATGMATRVGAVAALLRDKGDTAADDRGADSLDGGGGVVDGGDVDRADKVLNIGNGRGPGGASGDQVPAHASTTQQDEDEPRQSREKIVDARKRCFRGYALRRHCCQLPDNRSAHTPLQQSLERLAAIIGYFAIGVCLVVFVVGVALNTVDPEEPDTPSWMFMILVAVTLTVASIPSGLPLCVTIALSSGCKSMVKENVLMRNIAAVETLGSASIVCTDKTGTLTEGKMTTVAMHVGGVDYAVTGKGGFDPTDGSVYAVGGGGGQAVGEKSDDRAAGVLATLGSAVLCSDARLERRTDPDTGAVKWTPHGNSSEAPLVVAAHMVGITLEQLRLSHARVAEIPFSSVQKMMARLSVVGEKKQHKGLLKRVTYSSNFTFIL